MIIIYNKDKQKVQELVNKILQEHPEYGEVTVISDLSELPENIKIGEVVDTDTGVHIPDPDRKVISALVGDITKRLEDAVDHQSAENVIQAFEKAYQYHIPEIPNIEVPNIEKFVEENKTEFQKLSSFNRKEKNQARQKLEHQALKYQNKHWKK